MRLGSRLESRHPPARDTRAPPRRLAGGQAFWSIVGFEEVERPGTLGERSAWVERKGTHIHHQWQDDPVAPPEGHAAVVVDDWDAVVARLQDEGYEVTSDHATGARPAASYAPRVGTAWS